MKKFVFNLVLSLLFSTVLQAQDSQVINLVSGWSMISTYIQAVNPSLPTVFLPVYPDLAIAKNSTGQIFWPLFGINSIGTLQNGQGYQIKMVNPRTLVISGNLLNPLQTTLALPAGWSMLGVLHPVPALIASMLSPIAGKLVLVKSSGGMIYWPTFALNTIGNMQPGQAYLIKLTDSALFTYPSALPTVITAPAVGIAVNLAQCGGQVSNIGGSEVNVRGVCWNTTGNPTISDDSSNDGAGPGSFSSSLTGLNPATAYFVRAYASNNHGTGYGEVVQFTTLANLPTLTTTVTSISQTTATFGGTIVSNGGVTVTASGVCWNTAGSPTISDNSTSDGSGSDTFSIPITGLSPSTTYFVRAYATNSQGLAYGNEVTFTTLAPPPFTCGVSTLTDFDGNVYPTVQIGTQCWMKANLATTHYPDGTALVDGSSVGSTYGNSTTKYWFVYDNNLTQKATYGLLYSWAAAMNGGASSSANPSGEQGVCPNGWHLPSNNEWAQMEMCLGMTEAQAASQGIRGTDEGGKLKDTTLWYSPNTGATNSSGFTALPGGTRDHASFNQLEFFGFWWTSTELSSLLAWGRGLVYAHAKVYRDYYYKEYGQSVRCLRNTGGIWVQTPSVSTSTVGSITQTTANSGGDVFFDGGIQVTSRGVCWNTTGNPSISDSSTSDGTGSGPFTSSLTGLGPATLYYVRAYATNSQGTGYGNVVQFTTLANLPTVTTTSASSISQSTAISGGTIMSDGGAAVTACGVCWNTTGGPTVANPHTSDEPGTGPFTSNLTGLAPYTTYFVRAYATNSQGTAYGNEIQFTTLASMPIISTTPVSSITQTTAISGGTVISDGGATVTACGVCWNTTGEPTFANPHTTDGTGTSPFMSILSGLDPNTTYFVRAYASNSQGTAYGGEIQFTTLANLPTLTTTVTSISQTTATFGGTIVSNGGATVTASGVCWNTAGSPTISDNSTSDGSGSDTFSIPITGLSPSTTYFVRAYATNSQGLAYGNEVTFTTLAPPPFTCGVSTLTDFDGNVYPTVQIGTQCWMKANLATTHFPDGTPLVDGTNAGNTSGSTSTKYWFVYANNLTHKATYGLLYSWAAAMNGATSSSANPSGVQGVCPNGWHLPSDNEWAQMEMYLGMTQAQALAQGIRGTVEGGKLKATTIWPSPNEGATNSSGFTALPGGTRGHTSFDLLEYFGFWWTSTELSSLFTWDRGLAYAHAKVYREYYNKAYGKSVRCLRNTGGIWVQTPSVSTSPVSSITQTTANSGGDVFFDGGVPVTSRGVCWNTTGNPSISDSSTSDGTGSGPFTSSLTGLSPATLYYVRAYATNSQGTGYGNVVQFTTLAGVPTVTTTSASSISQTSAISGGTIISDGGAPVTACGVCWNTTGGPTVTSNPHTSDEPGIGPFTSSMTGLGPNNTYFVRAYATNSQGTAYGNEIQFTTPANLPIVTTTPVSSITQTTAISGGTVISNGGAAISARGVCWNMSGNPTIIDLSTNNGTGVSWFTSSLTGLSPNTTYFVRAYATNIQGTAYGEVVQFTTLAFLPIITTTPVTSISQTTATFGGTIMYDGGALVTGSGVCWNTAGNPTISDNSTSNGPGSATFSIPITGLSLNTTYFVRAYATNCQGLAYGNEVSFTTLPPPGFICGDSTVTDYDSNVYPTVQIGTQCWMKANLATTHYADGTSLVDGTFAGNTAEMYTSKYWFVYDNNLVHKATHGLLYSWAAAMNGGASSSANPSGVQGVCPTGWHVPSDDEWTQLEVFLGSSNAGGALKESGLSHWNNPNVGATNSSGFTALPGGYRNSNSWFALIGSYGLWWSATANNTTNAWYRSLYNGNAQLDRIDYGKNSGLSVRCLRDGL